MSQLRATRIAFVFLFVCVALVLFVAPAGVSVRATNERRAASNVRLAPPAPVFSDQERVAELIDHLQIPEIIGTIAGDNTIFVAPAAGVIAADVAAKLREQVVGQ